MSQEKVYILTYREEVLGQYATFEGLWNALQAQSLTENLTDGQLEYYLRKYAHMRFPSGGRWYAVRYDHPQPGHPVGI